MLDHIATGTYGLFNPLLLKNAGDFGSPKSPQLPTPSLHCRSGITVLHIHFLPSNAKSSMTFVC
jgi:hypothetical protein